jgi:hypothetical protein
MSSRTPSYPPSNNVMFRKCTKNICDGNANRLLYDLVTKELCDYLNQPGLTAEQLFSDFSDTPGSFYDPQEPYGEWLSWRFAPGWQNIEAVEELLNSSPASAQDIMSVKDIGPDTFYDMFIHTLLRMITDRGECLPIFRPFAGMPSNLIITNQNTRHKYYVRLRAGISFDLNNLDKFFVFPDTGNYSIQIAVPKMEFYDPSQQYQEADLIATPYYSQSVSINSQKRIRLINIEANGLFVNVSVSERWKLAIIKQKTNYWAGKGSTLYNKNGRPCNGGTPCRQFASKKQEDVEGGIVPIRSVKKPARYWDGRLCFPDLETGVTYKVILYSENDNNLIVASVCNIELNNIEKKYVRLPHEFDPRAAYNVFNGGVPEVLPSKAFLSGDIMRQYQQETSNCGTFSLALAASYWYPFTYNQLKRNGKWMEDNHGDWEPWTGQGTMEEVSGRLGFNPFGMTLDSSISRANGIKVLKYWIAAGIPVIVNIDEDQDTSTFGGEHYKVLIGYNDDAILHYTKDNGSEGTVRGALYFANPGAKGRDEGDPSVRRDDIAPTRRENHNDYNYVPIGNDVDSYKAFFYKWKHGGYWPATSDLWYLPFFPAYFKCGKCKGGPNHRVLGKSALGRSHWRYMIELVPWF